jgi:hypothetical protein
MMRCAGVVLGAVLVWAVVVPAEAQVFQGPGGSGVVQRGGSVPQTQGGVPQGRSDSRIYGNPWAKPESWQQAPVPYRNPSGGRPQPPCRYGERGDAINMYGCR